MKHDGVPFPDAVRYLAEQAGVVVPESRPVSAAELAERDERKTLERRLLDAQDRIAAYLSDTLHGPRGGQGRAYLERRGIDKRTAEAFRLGWADGDARRFAQWIESNEIALDDLDALGFVVKPDDGWRLGAPVGGGYLRFRRRVIFPIVDIRGEVMGFGGRIVDDDIKAAKYINSPETPVYTKGDNLYGAWTARHAARRRGRVVVCEGNIDVIAMWSAGFEGTVAAMGTALTPKQARLVKRLNENVVCVMDGDDAGRQAAFKSLTTFLDVGVHPRAVILPPGEDPDSYLAGNGAQAFEKRLDEAVPLLDLVISEAVLTHPADPPGRAAALRAVAPALGRIDDPLEHALYTDKIAAALEVPESLVAAAVDGSRRAVAEADERRRKSTRREASASPSRVEASMGPARPSAPSPTDEMESMRVLADVVGSDGGVAAPDFGPPSDIALPLDLEPPAWLDVPSNDDLGSSAGFVRAPATARSPTAVHVSPLQVKVVELLMHFPDMVVDFQTEGGIESLTHSGLAAFFAELCSQVRAGQTPNEDRLLTNIEDTALSAFLMERLAATPDQTRESARDALTDACRNLRLEDVNRKIKKVCASILESYSDDAAVDAFREELARLQELRDLISKGAH